jgi:hypothetical protein
MTYYFKQKPKLIDPMIKKKINKVLNNTLDYDVSLINICKSVLNNCVYIYNNYIDDHIYLIIIILLLLFFLWYRYNYKLKMDIEYIKKKKIITNIVPNDILYDNIINYN